MIFSLRILIAYRTVLDYCTSGGVLRGNYDRTGLRVSYPRIFLYSSKLT